MPPKPLLATLCGLLLAASACGLEPNPDWEEGSIPSADDVRPGPAASDVEQEPDPAAVRRDVDQGLSEIEGWEQDLAEWQRENPGQQLGADDGLDDPEPYDPALDEPATTLYSGRSCRDASGGKRQHLTMLQVGRLARKIGIRCGPRLVTAIAIAGAESANYKQRWHRNTNCTTDIGLWQINDYYHPQYAKTNLITNAIGMKRISGKGRRWTAWYARNTPTFRKYRQTHACNAAQRICGWKQAGNWRQRHCFCNLSNCH